MRLVHDGLGLVVDSENKYDSVIILHSFLNHTSREALPSRLTLGKSRRSSACLLFSCVIPPECSQIRINSSNTRLGRSDSRVQQSERIVSKYVRNILECQKNRTLKFLRAHGVFLPPPLVQTLRLKKDMHLPSNTSSQALQ